MEVANPLPLQFNPRAQSRQAIRAVAVTVLAALVWMYAKAMKQLTEEALQQTVEWVLG